MSLPELSKYPYVAVDFETTGLNWWKDKPFMVSVATPDNKQWWVDLENDPDGLAWARAEIPKIKKPIFHNAKFDTHFGREIGIHIDPMKAHCTIIRMALLNEHLRQYDLDYLGQKFLGIGKVAIIEELAEMFGGRATKNVQMPNLHKAPRPFTGKYANRDTELTLKLFEWQEPKMIEEDLGRVYQLERDLLPVLVDIEHRGVRVDVEQTEKAVDAVTDRINFSQRGLNALVGFDMNVESPKDIKRTFNPRQKDGSWFTNKGESITATDKGNASFNADNLKGLKDPKAELILKVRKFRKLRDTFLKGHILGSHHNGVVHTTFNQTKNEGFGTGTGRLSSNGPNLQQINKRDEETASIIRALFIPDKGQEWVCRDWSQMDFRIFAHYVNQPNINKQYARDPDTDFHQLVSDMAGIPRTAKDAIELGVKGNAKQINLGLVFGMGEGGLAKEMSLPYTLEKGRGGRMWTRPGPEAETLFAKYHREVPGVKSLLQKASSVAKSRGYVKTALGRKLRFPGGNFTYKAGGLIFQGTAADALKYKMVEVWNLLKDTEGRLLLNVHDEMDMSLPKGDKLIDPEVEHIMADFQGPPFNLKIPIRSDVGTGPNWWEACKE